MRSNAGISVFLFVLVGCWDSHERDNPLDQKGENWNDSIIPIGERLTVSQGEADSIEYKCTVPAPNDISLYILEASTENSVVQYHSTDGTFRIFFGKDDLSLTCIIVDRSGSRLRSPYPGGIHRNIPPRIDSTPKFESWTELDRETGLGRGIIRLPIFDDDSEGDYVVRVDLNGKMGVWDTVQGFGKTPLLELEIDLQYKSSPTYRIVIKDPLGDSAEVTGTLALDTIAPCQFLGPTSFVDPRDGREYSCAWIGYQAWMTENLNFGKVVSASKPQEDKTQMERYCMGDSAEGCAESGGYYQWAEAVGEIYSCNNTGTCVSNVNAPQGVCPPGWHVPGQWEWYLLITSCLDSSFFDKAFQGYVNLDGNFQDGEEFGDFWTSTADTTGETVDQSNFVQFSRRSDSLPAWEFKTGKRRWGLSIRCVMD